MYKISEFAKLINVNPMTLRRWDKADILKPEYFGNSKHRRYTDDHLRQVKSLNFGKNKECRLNIIYARESTINQKASLENQVNKCKEFCIAQGIKIDTVISEYGSALNYKREGLNELISYITLDRVDKIIIYYKDRLLRFGFELIQNLCTIHNVDLIVIDSSETDKTKEQEFAEDLISIIHHFSMKLYGSRSYKKKVKAAKENIEEIVKEQLN